MPCGDLILTITLTLTQGAIRGHVSRGTVEGISIEYENNEAASLIQAAAVGHVARQQVAEMYDIDVTILQAGIASKAARSNVKSSRTTGEHASASRIQDAITHAHHELLKPKPDFDPNPPGLSHPC